MLEEYKNVKGNEMESNYFKLFKFPLQFCFDFAISGFYVSETLKLKLQYCMFLLVSGLFYCDFLRFSRAVFNCVEGNRVCFGFVLLRFVIG